jgi:hypothetical protein
MTKKNYKPIKEERYWDSRARYEDMKTSGELFVKHPTMIGIWSYDMSKFLELDETLKQMDKEEPIKKEEPKSGNTQWYDEKG